MLVQVKHTTRIKGKWSSLQDAMYPVLITMSDHAQESQA